MELGSFADYFRLPARVYAALAIVAATLLFLPTAALDAIALNKFATDHRPWIGIVFLLAIALLIAELGHHGWRFFRAKAVAREGRAEQARKGDEEKRAAETTRAELLQQLIERLSKLTSDEKAMLTPFVAKNLRAQRLPMNNAALKALQGSQVLGVASQVMNYDFKFNDYAVEVFIQPWALEHLQKHPELLER